MYFFVKYLLTPFIFFFYMPKIIGRKNSRIKGKAIVISNHISMGDPLFISAVFRRQILWMGKIELFETKLSAAFFTAVRTFPVRRGEGDLAAIRHSFKVLRDGDILGIFPEGTRDKNGKIRDFEPGTSMIALKNDTPVIPIYIKGEYKMFRRMTMIIGEPIILSKHIEKGSKAQTSENATRFLQNKLKEMKESLD